MNIVSCGMSHIGRIRNENQDAYSIDDSVGLYIVADGMGGMSQGELASKLAIETVLESPLPLENHTKEECQEWLTSLFVQANEKVSAQVKDGGTTLSVIFAFSEQLMIGHVGDSRRPFRCVPCLDSVDEDLNHIVINFLIIESNCIHFVSVTLFYL